MNTSTSPRRAAQYVRMSTDHQRYSIEYQSIANAAYAAEHGLEIVATYQDAGISGLGLEKRAGLKRLLADVLGGAAEFSAVVVYDVSRWGRFQDPDESAHYEYMCKAAGVQVEYSAEVFENDGSLSSAIVKTLKRVMAAEYSRDLSERVSRTKQGLGSKGFWTGGVPGYGLRRCQVDEAGFRWPRMERGEVNARVGCRIILVPGPAEEVATVRRIFHMAAVGRLSPPKIAAVLNAEGLPLPLRPRWSDHNIRYVLRNELYMGTLVFGREKSRLGHWQRQPEKAWIRVRDAFEPIITERRFRAAARRSIRFTHRSEDELLDYLRRLWAKNGRLTSRLIYEDSTGPSPGAYRHRFGSMRRAYELIGYEMSPWQRRSSEIPRILSPSRSAWNDLHLPNDEVIRRLVQLRQDAGELTLNLIDLTPGIPGPEALVRRFGSTRRIYELAGHTPNARQSACLARAERRPRKARTRKAETPT